MKKIPIIISVLLLFLCFLGSPAFAEMIDYGVSPNEATIEVGEYYQFDPYYETDDGSLRFPFFYKENKEDDGYSLTDDGLVRGLKAGDYTIHCGFKEEGNNRYNFVSVILHVKSSSNNQSLLNISENKNKQSYDRWASVIGSYLVKQPDGYMIVSQVDGVAIDYFDNNFQWIDHKTIDNELPIFGGFYNGTNYFFLVFGQENPNESDDCEVIRVVKYDKNWNRVGVASLKGANTYVPFEAGSLRMAEQSGELCIRTSHKMYAHNGLHHQANMTIQIHIPTMKIVNTNHEVSNYGTGYVSHSFNQFIIVEDNGDIVALDHGDAYPRAALLGVYGRKVQDLDNNDFSYYSQPIINYAGQIGDNTTNASIGGLAASDSNYLTVGNSSDQNNENSTTRNVYLSVTPKDNLGMPENNTKLTWLTNYSDPIDSTSTPILVKFSDDNFVVIWSSDKDEDNNISYVFVDGNGNPKGNVVTKEGDISDCQPIVENSKASWYVSHRNSVILYTLDSNGNLSKTVATEPTDPEEPDKPSDPTNPDSPSTPTDPSTSVAIYRLYDSSSGEHLYTPSPDEVTALVNSGWTDEGIGWTAPQTGMPVYRIFNPTIGDHLYTTDENEVESLTAEHGWIKDFEGKPIFYSGGNTNVYRLYNEANGRHHLTTDEYEYNLLPSHGWIQEGIAILGV